jgi:hypothetical protein
MCGGGRKGRAALRAATRNLGQNQEESYEYYGLKKLSNDLKAAYGKPKPKRKAPEAAFQIQVARYLAKALPEGYWFSAFPAGGGGRIRGARLKAMGLKAGVPDMVVFGPYWEGDRAYPYGPTMWLEFKAKAGSLSAVQKDVHAHLKALGHRVAVVRTLEQVQDELAEFCFPEAIRAKVGV